jgi:hypothetical protein
MRKRSRVGVGYEQLAVLQLSEVQGALPRRQGSDWAKVRWGRGNLSPVQ